MILSFDSVPRFFNLLINVFKEGATNIKKLIPEALFIFIMPPSVEVLRERLIGRATDSMETIEKRVAKAEFEISKAQEFDHVIVNDILSEAVEQTKQVISGFISK